MADLLNFEEIPNLLELAQAYGNDPSVIWGRSEGAAPSLTELSVCADEGADAAAGVRPETDIEQVGTIFSVCADEGGTPPALGLKTDIEQVNTIFSVCADEGGGPVGMTRA